MLQTLAPNHQDVVSKVARPCPDYCPVRACGIRRSNPASKESRVQNLLQGYRHRSMLLRQRSSQSGRRARINHAGGQHDLLSTHFPQARIFPCDNGVRSENRLHACNAFIADQAKLPLVPLQLVRHPRVQLVERHVLGEKDAASAAAVSPSPSRPHTSEPCGSSSGNTPRTCSMPHSG